jgi:hypothetical protein
LTWPAQSVGTPAGTALVSAGRSSRSTARARAPRRGRGAMGAGVQRAPAARARRRRDTPGQRRRWRGRATDRRWERSWACGLSSGAALAARRAAGARAGGSDREGGRYVGFGRYVMKSASLCIPLIGQWGVADPGQAHRHRGGTRAPRFCGAPGVDRFHWAPRVNSHPTPSTAAPPDRRRWRAARPGPSPSPRGPSSRHLQRPPLPPRLTRRTAVARGQARRRRAAAAAARAPLHASAGPAATGRAAAAAPGAAPCRWRSRPPSEAPVGGARAPTAAAGQRPRSARAPRAACCNAAAACGSPSGASRTGGGAILRPLPYLQCDQDHPSVLQGERPVGVLQRHPGALLGQDPGGRMRVQARQLHPPRQRTGAACKSRTGAAPHGGAAAFSAGG